MADLLFGGNMAGKVAIGYQDFEKLRMREVFYVDKTDFIREWWESGDDVTLIARPRRFGKTLNMSMLECFFSLKYKDRGELFEGLLVWQNEAYRKLQGTYPVLFLSFAGVKETSFPEARKNICRCIEELYNKHDFLLEGNLLNDKEKEFYQEVSANMPDSVAAMSLRSLADFLGRYYGKKVIILLDEYDTPMQEAYVAGYWKEMVSFIRSLFNSTFKTNPFLERAVMTGITRVSKESIFSDLNNLEVVTTTSDKYATAFGFTEQETFAALEVCGLGTEKEEVKRWYDGFVFGNHSDIYNPWSIINFLDKKKLGTYWANTSSNSLAGKLVREGSPVVKENFETLMQRGTITAAVDEQIVYNQLDEDEDAIWSLLLASGYLKALSVDDTPFRQGLGAAEYTLALTNMEVRSMFASMIRGWFKGRSRGDYNGFIKALLADDRKLMNIYMNKVALDTISHFDSGNHPSENEPERFYHGLVLGLLVDLYDRYAITSNRESGYGRYDIMLEPKSSEDPAVIMEFKVHDPDEEKTLQDTVASALGQIREKKYAQSLLARGIPAERIRSYGFAFEGKKVLVGGEVHNKK